MSRFVPTRVASVALSLAAAVAAPVVLLPQVTFAQDANTALGAAPSVSPASDPLQASVEDYWHYGKVARYDVAAAKANEILASGAEPLKVLEAFEKVTRDRGDNLDEWLARWQGVDQLKDVTTKLNDVINQGRYTRRAEPGYIEKNVARLNGGDRPYRLAMAQLRESGELAVPAMLAVLNDPNKADLHGAVRRGLVGLGRSALSPLCAATMSDDPAQVELVCTLLGELGYDSAVPYLAAVAANGSENVKRAAQASIQRINTNGTATPMTGTPGDLFYDLANKQYYGRTSLVADLRYPQANVWSFDKGKGLVRTPVPPSIFNDVMSMGQAEMAMRMNAKMDALSLWLAGDFKREADLPQGQTDDTRMAGAPDAHFYGVTAGAQYLNAVLTRALNDKNNAVSLSSVKALQEIVGDANFKSGGSPLIDAMQSPDRRVRFEAAFTLAEALPQQPFQGQELVVPLLAEAISQTGQPSVLVVGPSNEMVNGLVQPLKAEGFIAAGATAAAAALSTASSLPAIDVILISEDLSPVETESLLGLVARSPKLRAAGKLFMVHSAASQWNSRKASDPTISTTTVMDAAGLKDEITKARDATGALPLDPALATMYATRAGELIKNLAISRGQVLDLGPSRSTLLGALEDARPDVAKLAGQGLALMNSDDAQKGLLLRATTEGVPDDVKMSLFKSLATSAKFFGNKLDAGQIAALDGVVTGTGTPDVKSAAAEARGALDLPADQARKLILNPTAMPASQPATPAAPAAAAPATAAPQS